MYLMITGIVTGNYVYTSIWNLSFSLSSVCACENFPFKFTLIDKCVLSYS